jgi:ketosteroid isomerase-like protein
MKKKYGFNIVFFGYIAILFLIISCNKSVNRPEQGQLLKADMDFSALSAREGMHKAFLEYVADSGVILRDKSYPLEGRRAIEALFEGRSDSTFVLTWEPVYEKIALSGELGYTYGYFTSKTLATGEEDRGTYLTIWQKQPDGRWKFVMDTGTDGLPAKSE